VISPLKSSPSLTFFQQALHQEHSLLIEGLWDAPKAALLYLTALAAGKSLLIITGGSRENRLLDNLSYFGLAEQALEFPSWETLPGEEITPSPDIVGRRFEILSTLLKNKQPALLFATLQGCLQKVVTPSLLTSFSMEWKKGDELPFHKMAETLERLGYRRVAVVSDKGEFAVRGGIVDLFPLSSPDPFRVEFFGDTIDEIRTFDPIGQKSIAKVDFFFLPPASEKALLEKGSVSLLDYLPKNCCVIFDDLLSLEDSLVSLKGMPGIESPFFTSFETFFKKCRERQHMYWTEERIEELSEVEMKAKVGRAFYSGKQPLQPLSFEIFQEKIATKRWAHPFAELADFFTASENRAAASSEEMLHGLSRFSDTELHVHFITASEHEEQVLKEKLSAIKLPRQTVFERGYLSSGFCIADSHRVFFPMTEFTKSLRTRRLKWRSTYHTPAAEFHELKPGDIVVHFHQGIGKFLGIEKRPNHAGLETEFLVIEYSEGSKLYVPIAQSHLVSRYIGAKDEIPTFHTLGTQKWHHAKERAEKAIIGYAQDLLRLAAEREIQGGIAFPPDSAEMEAFEKEFPFVETEDQLLAIAEIKKDMLSAKAMDRLICGDVGYGKTEVAMRAAFKAVVDGKKQVALLVPTTVLSLQHFETFKQRMANFPVTLAVISRFQTPREVKQALDGVLRGSIDILIGTHRLISKDVHFKDLGLIIIDEEQRFGVRAKEQLKAFKAGVDCLTLSATPIPRTLYLSLLGGKEISLINTPPQDRLPIKTIIAEREAPLIQNALLRELARDGQVFFIHNRVETIFQVTEELRKLIPQAKVIVGHGQMSSEEIDTVFHAFKEGSADVLVATTIVENGVDIPNANTILIDRADQFGLADLYQLRGRVGRWNRPAYAYFLTPQHRALPELTRKRLHALLETSGHGGGMKIAMRDLEIRGAGDILGVKQSGQIATIGFHLYCKLLKRTIAALRKKSAPSFFETKMEFTFDARLPEEYISETTLRMEIYHRLGEVHSPEDVEEIAKELKDRFGPLPPQVIWLLSLTRIRILASSLGITLLKFETYTFTVEKLKGKTATRKGFTLPKVKKLEEFEKAICEQLTAGF
jgi:transcription-repair coupling factor (superfamily II helicase)